MIDVLYELGEAHARQIADALGEPESYDSIRVTLGSLEKQGLLQYRVDGRRHIYSPAQSRSEASRSAWRRLLRMFFGGSPGRALISLLDTNGHRIADDELAQLSEWVNEQSELRRRKP